MTLEGRVIRQRCACARKADEGADPGSRHQREAWVDLEYGGQTQVLGRNFQRSTQSLTVVFGGS